LGRAWNGRAKHMEMSRYLQYNRKFKAMRQEEHAGNWKQARIGIEEECHSL